MSEEKIEDAVDRVLQFMRDELNLTTRETLTVLGRATRRALEVKMGVLKNIDSTDAGGEP